MNGIDTRTPFFPRTASRGNDSITANKSIMRRNTYDRAQSLNDTTARDAKVTIPESIKDYSRIKRVVDASPEVDNTDKIARLRSQIQAGTYQPDYDAIADKMLTSEF